MPKKDFCANAMKKAKKCGHLKFSSLKSVLQRGKDDPYHGEPGDKVDKVDRHRIEKGHYNTGEKANDGTEDAAYYTGRIACVQVFARFPEAVIAVIGPAILALCPPNIEVTIPPMPDIMVIAFTGGYIPGFAARLSPAHSQRR